MACVGVARCDPMQRSLPLGVTLALLLTTSGVALAQSVPPTLRGSDQDGYSRLVLDFGTGQTPPQVTVQAVDATTLAVSFAGAAAPNLPAIDLQAIDGVKADLADGAVRLTLTRPKDATYRTLTIAGRQILDVYHASSPERDVKPEPKPQETKEEETKAEKPSAAVEIGLTLTLSEAAGMSVFRRDDALYLVLDTPDVAIPPQVTGTADVFGPPERLTAPEATIFRLPILRPDALKSLQLVGDGAGLIWYLKGQKDVSASHVKLPIAADSGRITWPAKLTRRVVTFEDPVMGDRLFAVTVSDAKQFAGAAPYRTPQVTLLPSFIGLGGVAAADDVTAAILPDKTVQITRPGGLKISVPAVEAEVAPGKPSPQSAAAGPRFFTLDRWAMGGRDKLRANHTALITTAGQQEGEERAQTLMKLAQLHLAHGQGAEAQGVLKLAADTLPALAETPNYKALRGAAAVVAGQYDLAVPFLLSPSLDTLSDIKIWRAAMLAGLGDWAQAGQFLPVMPEMLKGYTQPIKDDLSLTLAEVALRDGAIQQAQMLLEPIAANRPTLAPYQAAYLAYLEGEVARQAGDKARAAEIWERLVQGREDYFRVRAGLALVTLKDQDEKIEPAAAIDILESLRYAWRGDELEIDVASKLGEMYIANKDYLRGLAILRAAAGVTGFPKASERIATRMREVYADVMADASLATLTPVQALTLYRDFGELMPPGAEGAAILRSLSDKLMEAGMIEPAQELLGQQGKTATTPADILRVQMRLAGLALQEGDANATLGHLTAAEKQLASMDVTQAVPTARDIAFMRARAYVLQDKVEDALRALSLLPQDGDVLRLRADMAWKANKWKEAAEALEQLVQAEDLPDTRPISAAQAGLILNWAVALNLSGNRFVLSTVRERYGDMMAQTEKAKEFEVVTRPRQKVVLSDRDTIKGMVGEVSLFKDFLDSYAKSSAPEKEVSKPTPDPAKPGAEAAPQAPVTAE